MPNDYFDEEYNIDKLLEEEAHRYKIRANIKKGVGTFLVGTVLLGGVAGLALESGVDHTKELCPYTKVFGYEHQVNAINRLTDGTTAKFDEVDNIPEGFVKEIDENGNEWYVQRILPTYSKEYSVPKGYSIELNERGERIGVARSVDGGIVGISDVEEYIRVNIPTGYMLEDGYAVKRIPVSKEKVITVYNDQDELISVFPTR